VERLRFIEQISPVKNKSFPSLSREKCSRTQDFLDMENILRHAEVLEDAYLIVIPIDKFEEILISYPELCIKIFKVLGEKIVDLQGRLEAQVLHNTYEQIILLLIRLCKSNGEKKEQGYKLTTQFTNRELANMIGTSRETVSRTINQLKKKEYVLQNDEGFYLLDHEALKQELFY
jgi:CRP-like cAMP-binding protein